MGIAITQKYFIKEALKEFDMTECRPVVTFTEMSAAIKLTRKNGC